MTTELKVMVGVPGSGKSTWIEQEVARLEDDHRTTCVVSRDFVRKSLLNDHDGYFDKETEVFNEFVRQINEAMELGIDVVFADATHISPASRAKLLGRLAADPHTKLTFEVIDVPLDVAIKRNAQREIAVAEAENAKASNDARVKAEEEIAKRNNSLAIQKAQLKQESDTKQAQANAAMEIESENQRKLRDVAAADADIARQEKEIDLKEREVTIKERALEAEVKKTAEAKKYAAQQEADARLYATQKQSEADLYERQKTAEAERFEAEQRAEAQRATAEAIRIQGEAEAAAAKARGEAEAAAIQAKAEAEAEGLMKKAEAMKQYGEAAKMDMQMEALKMYFQQLPAIAEATGQAYTNVDKIVMFGDNTSKLSGDIINNVAQISEGLSESLGIDVKAMLAGFLGGKIADKN